jgi:N-acetylglucosaminyldiphosphoundecaprenol N-acetyl-beta-D-mannosaminyltransferase
MRQQTQTEQIAKDVAEVRLPYSRVGVMRRKLRRGLLGTFWKFATFVSTSGKRIVDVLVAGLLLAMFSPLFLVIAICNEGTLFVREIRIGRWGFEFQMLRFNTTGPCGRIITALKLHPLPLFINVLRGDLSLVGPRAVLPGELSARARAVRKRSSVRPGLLSLWWLRQMANIDFGSEIDVDLEYVEQQSTGGDLGIALRSLPAMLYGASSPVVPDQVEILKVPIRNIAMDDALQFIMDAARGSSPQQVCFVNTDCVNKAQHNAAYAGLLSSCSAVFADGIGIRLAGKILRTPIRQNVNGTDLFPRLCGRLQGSEIGLYLLGARPGITESVARWVEKNYPGASVKGIQHGFFTPEEEPGVIDRINNSGAEILLVAFGSPRQDMWIAEHLPDLRVGIAMGVGGLFDFYSGQMPRAPQWLRELSLEWVYRLCQEPGRMWRRYLLGNIVFLSRVLYSIVNRRRPLHSLDIRGH